jgi:hypothetical protein
MLASRTGDDAAPTDDMGVRPPEPSPLSVHTADADSEPDRRPPRRGLSSREAELPRRTPPCTDTCTLLRRPKMLALAHLPERARCASSVPSDNSLLKLYQHVPVQALTKIRAPQQLAPSYATLTRGQRVSSVCRSCRLVQQQLQQRILTFWPRAQNEHMLRRDLANACPAWLAGRASEKP